MASGVPGMTGIAVMVPAAQAVRFPGRRARQRALASATASSGARSVPRNAAAVEDRPAASGIPPDEVSVRRVRAIPTAARLRDRPSRAAVRVAGPVARPRWRR
jgi:hypothetical protein